MNELCGMDCCSKCSLRENMCAGCAETDGHPCGGMCTLAECIKVGGKDAMLKQKSEIIEEVNSLGIENLSVNSLFPLIGSYVNLEYPLPNGQKVKLLKDNKVYWGNQIERPDSERCYGLVADEAYLLVCEYGCNGADPEIILYKKR